MVAVGLPVMTGISAPLAIVLLIVTAISVLASYDAGSSVEFTRTMPELVESLYAVHLQSLVQIIAGSAVSVGVLTSLVWILLRFLKRGDVVDVNGPSQPAGR